MMLAKEISALPRRVRMSRLATCANTASSDVTDTLRTSMLPTEPVAAPLDRAARIWNTAVG